MSRANRGSEQSVDFAQTMDPHFAQHSQVPKTKEEGRIRREGLRSPVQGTVCSGQSMDCPWAMVYA